MEQLDRKMREKRTLVVMGRRTTASLESEVWRSLVDIAQREQAPLSDIVDAIDRRRGDASLASGLRVFCLYYWKLLAQARNSTDAKQIPGLSDTYDPPGLFDKSLKMLGRNRSDGGG